MADEWDDEPQGQSQSQSRGQGQGAGWSRAKGWKSGTGRNGGAGVRRWLAPAAGSVLLLAGGLGWWAAPTDGAMVGAPVPVPAVEAGPVPQSEQAVAVGAASGMAATGGMASANKVREEARAGPSATVLPGGDVPDGARISSRGRQLLSDEEREARRFRRQDRDKDGAVSREEFLASRRKSFERLDKDGDAQLSFEEYAATTAARFEAADSNDDRRLNRTEFATTATPRSSGRRSAGEDPAGGTAGASRGSS